MADVTKLEDRVVAGDLSVVDFACQKIEGQIARMRENNPDLLWTLEIQEVMWKMYRDAQKSGKKLVIFGGSIPMEILAAFDCVPLYLDSLPFRLCTNSAITGKFIDESEKYVPSSMCGLSKVEMGALLCRQYGVDPDAFVYTTVPCDSSRIAFPNMEQILKVPTFTFDTPFRRDDRGYDYLADQIEALVVFMEGLTGKKLDWEKLKYYMEISNEVYELQAQCANLRKKTPCPLPGRLLILNGTTNAMACYPEMADLLRSELELGTMMAELGMSPCPDGEKYRIAFLQNMLWSWAGVTDWLEKEYNAVTVMDAFGFRGGHLFQKLDDRRDCFRIMGRRMQDNPMIHGASGPAEHHLHLVDTLMDEYKANVSFFIGHIGCKHSWASAKMVSDMVQEKYGIPTLYVDVDCIDGRYKTREDIKAEITQYMESVVMK
ncbi:MAG: 2-hydroxyacyl-CoA dehydratase family protein [Bacillota bacterium]